MSYPPARPNQRVNSTAETATGTTGDVRTNFEAELRWRADLKNARRVEYSALPGLEYWRNNADSYAGYDDHRSVYDHELADGIDRGAINDIFQEIEQLSTFVDQLREYRRYLPRDQEEFAMEFEEYSKRYQDLNCQLTEYNAAIEAGGAVTQGQMVELLQLFIDLVGNTIELYIKMSKLTNQYNNIKQQLDRLKAEIDKSVPKVSGSPMLRNQLLAELGWEVELHNISTKGRDKRLRTRIVNNGQQQCEEVIPSTEAQIHQRVHKLKQVYEMINAYLTKSESMELDASNKELGLESLESAADVKELRDHLRILLNVHDHTHRDYIHNMYEIISEKFTKNCSEIGSDYKHEGAPIPHNMVFGKNFIEEMDNLMMYQLQPFIIRIALPGIINVLIDFENALKDPKDQPIPFQPYRSHSATTEEWNAMFITANDMSKNLQVFITFSENFSVESEIVEMVGELNSYCMLYFAMLTMFEVGTHEPADQNKLYNNASNLQKLIRDKFMQCQELKSYLQEQGDIDQNGAPAEEVTATVESMTSEQEVYTATQRVDATPPKGAAQQVAMMSSVFASQENAHRNGSDSNDKSYPTTPSKPKQPLGEERERLADIMREKRRTEKHGNGEQRRCLFR